MHPLSVPGFGTYTKSYLPGHKALHLLHNDFRKLLSASLASLRVGIQKMFVVEEILHTFCTGVYPDRKEMSLKPEYRRWLEGPVAVSGFLILAEALEFLCICICTTSALIPQRPITMCYEKQRGDP